MGSLTALPVDTLFLVLSFISAREIDTNVSPVCCRLCELTSSPKLWKELCAINGKVLGVNDISKKRSFFSNENGGKASYAYRDYYYSNPCVPTDYKTISKALENCSAGSEVVLLPGIYHERIVLGNFENRAQDETTPDKVQVSIRAAFPEKGCCITFLSSTAMNEACIHIRGVNVSANISNVQILHSSRGNDIWSGNCAVFCEDGALVSMHGCKITSESGRGVVVIRGSIMTMTNSTVCDCAATGCYVSDAGTTFNISSSNVIRNGIGTRRSASILAASPGATNLFDDVPAGHSGLYIESAKSIIDNCLISGNVLTGVSVVRNGDVHISKCDLTQNGEEGLIVEANEGDDEFQDNIQEDRVFWNFLAGPESNNHCSRHPSDHVLLGGLIRPCTYTAVFTDTLDSLQAQYPDSVPPPALSRRL